jgi:hypothetical protein
MGGGSSSVLRPFGNTGGTSELLRCQSQQNARPVDWAIERWAMVGKEARDLWQ